MRPRNLGELPETGRDDKPYSRPTLAPDSRYLLLPNGKVYWLAGAGPMPEVDPSAKWKP
ncbi:MAG: hypothetical protein L0241_22285 [Planctomycetia bacterium]|nr:hypothetical protein [Planctomycetia bacterium]